MSTPVGGPSQLLVKCRNNNASLDIVAGMAVSLVGTSKDTDAGVDVLLVEPLVKADGSKFLGVALEDADASTDSDAVATGKGQYLNVCIFGAVQARVSGVGSAGIVPGEAVAASIDPAIAAAGSEGELAGLGILGDAAGGSVTGGAAVEIVGMGLETGEWGSSGGSQTLSWVFLNGIGRHAHGGT